MYTVSAKYHFVRGNVLIVLFYYIYLNNNEKFMYNCFQPIRNGKIMMFDKKTWNQCAYKHAHY